MCSKSLLFFLSRQKIKKIGTPFSLERKEFAGFKFDPGPDLGTVDQLTLLPFDARRRWKFHDVCVAEMRGRISGVARTILFRLPHRLRINQPDLRYTFCARYDASLAGFQISKRSYRSIFAITRHSSFSLKSFLIHIAINNREVRHSSSRIAPIFVCKVSRLSRMAYRLNRYKNEKIVGIFERVTRKYYFGAMKETVNFFSIAIDLLFSKIYRI